MPSTSLTSLSRQTLSALLILLFEGAVFGASDPATAIRGQVVSSRGVPVEHARIETAPGSLVIYSDPRGEFVLEGVSLPVVLETTHPRFESSTVRVDGIPEETVVIVLEPKQRIYEEIAVSANRGEDNFSPVTVAAATIAPAESGVPMSHVTEAVAEIPGVAENGQGGIFQSYSVRGVSRQRVLTLLSGMRLVGERRAGVSASFVDPLLLDSVDVLRSPSSTFYGSGALGGVVQLFPRRFERLTVRAGHESEGRESSLFAAGGGQGWSWGLAGRDAEEAETPSGELLNSAFRQLSGTLQKSWEAGPRDYRLLVLASSGRDIGKANTDFPERTTVYPREEHLLVQFGLRSEKGWSFEAAIHPNELETRVDEEGQGRSELSNRAFDLGLNWQKQLAAGGWGSARLGFDYFGRRGVDAREQLLDLTGGEPELLIDWRTLDGGKEDELGAYGAVEWNRGRAVLLAGGRLVLQRQKNGDQAWVEDTAVTGFVGFVVPFRRGWEWVGNLGSGLRFPSLGERFFSGTTGRGVVEGNTSLDPESSLSFDLGARWYGSRVFFAGYLFRNRIEDYIERVEIEPDLLTFVNLESGTIEGAEVEALYQVTSGWTLELGAHAVTGRSSSEEPLADIPSDRISLGSRWEEGRWSGEGRWESRLSKDDPGSGEKPILSAQLLSASLTYRWQGGLAVTLSGRNLLDEGYFNSADRKVPLAPGRSFGLALRWSAQE
jgi:iron complex outermembrane receptor protein